MIERRFLSGNQAIARGAWEAGVRFATGYPGTPSTEILETIAGMDGVDAHWASNEKVAFEEAMGYAIAGGRTLVTMKHVGLNVASDAFMVFPYCGTNGGFVVVSADDPGMHSSQNEQDNRYLARMARVPILEPADPQECHDLIVAAFDISETFGTPVMLRTTTRTAHCKGTVTLGERRSPPMVPSTLRAERFSVPIYRHRLRPGLEDRIQRLAAFGMTASFNRIDKPRHPVGVIASGISRAYAREILSDADFFDLAMTHPLPLATLIAFCAAHDTVYVFEEGDPFIEEQIRACGVANLVGKDRLGVMGEYSPERLAAVVTGGAAFETSFAMDAPAPPRPPMFCVGCGHRTVFDVLGQLRVTVAGDIGCYTMGALPPYEAEHTTFCMGASIGTAVGLVRAGVKRTVAVIGDSTFIHSGIPSLIDAVYTRTPVTVLILDNATTGMTGQQSHPGTGTALDGNTAPAVDIEALVQATGVRHAVVVDTWDRAAVRRAILAALAHDAPAVVIIRGPCQLLPEMRSRDIQPLTVVEDLCTGCNACYRIACPAITPGPNGLPAIDPALCVDCTVCQQFCHFDAIVTREAMMDGEQRFAPPDTRSST
ncbi:indolepyruvate ferredoxin oxidoreductase subunit alpha [bacterium]|nr:MAG: indolepyruvate ferredoxin oxidoreductase subunit alpha [bacterium]